MLPGLTSRCTNPAACAASNAPAACSTNPTARPGSNPPSDRRISRKSRPPTNSIARNSRPSASPASNVRTTFGCTSDPAISDSRKNRCRNRSSLASAPSNNFSATSPSYSELRARYTSPIAPRPRSSTNLNPATAAWISMPRRGSHDIRDVAIRTWAPGVSGEEVAEEGRELGRLLLRHVVAAVDLGHPHVRRPRPPDLGEVDAVVVGIVPQQVDDEERALDPRAGGPRRLVVLAILP